MRFGYFLFSFTLVSGCATATYTPPVARDYSNRLVVHKSFDKTWEDLIGYASETFFSIDNFEKASGLLTLTFGAGDASRFVDCGKFSGGPKNYEGSYVQYIQSTASAKLDGKMNLRVRSVGPEDTELTVNARYIFTIPSTTSTNFLTGAPVTYSASVFSFDSRSSDTQFISGASPGTPPSRTCQPTGEAENSIMRGINRQ